MTLHATRLRKCLFTITASLFILLLVSISAQGQNEITTCGTTITEQGVYVLANDLNCTGVDGIDIVADDVELHLGGRTITGSPDHVGIYTTGNRADVDGPGAIHGFSCGVKNEGGHAIVYGLTVSGADIGFCALNAQVEWSTNEASGNSTGFSTYSGRIILDYNLAYGNHQDGIHVSGGRDDRIEDNRVRENGAAGIYVNSDSASVDRNLAESNRDGVVVAGDNNRLDTNFSLINTAVGIDIFGSNTRIMDSYAIGNSLFDLADQNPNCGNNQWVHNTFGTANQDCIH